MPSGVTIGSANGFAAIDRSEDRAAKPQDARDVARRERPGLLGIDQAVEAVLEAEHLDARVVRRLDDGADDGIQAGSVAAAGEHTDFLDLGHMLKWGIAATRRRCVHVTLNILRFFS